MDDDIVDPIEDVSDNIDYVAYFHCKLIFMNTISSSFLPTIFAFKREMKTEDFSSCCAGTTFANEMAITSSFSSLEHAIMVARDIWSRKLNVRSWLEAISGRSCSNEYLETVNEATVQELHEWRSRYEEKFGYVFVTFVAGRTSEDILAELKMRFNNSHGVELEIASKEELKYIEHAIRELLFKKSVQTTDEGDVSTEYSGEIVTDTLDGADTIQKMI
ncbi:uric acid degradation bifunctional protein TTL-like [Arachis stenosperma]|uniref:uric acid degradation bifunctional protein TTL-like n=1 Tax=Arachis stenosperma TaxID=217475 RepID=UPI0025AB8407|nr:uric acid degradation bifunctional protein TTL-like [Arachis stenosperma]